MSVWALWLIAACLLLLAEMLTLTFYLLCLSAGAVAACLTSLLWPDNIWLQMGVGSAAALVSTVFSRRWTERLRMKGKGFRDTGTEIEGRQGIVVQDIEAGRFGMVKVGGDTWTASAETALAAGETVRVVRRSATIIEVKRWEDSEEWNG